MGKKNGRQLTSARKADDTPEAMFGRLDENTLEALDLGIYIVDTELNLVLANSQIKELLSQSKNTASEIIGKPLFEIFPGMPKDIVRDYEKAFKTRKPAFIKDVVLDLGDREIIAEMRIVTLTNENQITHAMTTVRDITESIRTREALEMSEKKYRLLVENVKASIIISDRDGKILYINETAARTLDGTPDQLVGKTPRHLFPGEIADQQLAAIRKVIDSGINDLERMRVKIGDRWRWFDVNIQPFKDQSGTIVGAMVIAFDVTGQQKIEEALRSSEERVRLLIDNVQAHIVLVDYDGDFLFSNKSAAASMNLEPQEMIGKRQKDLFPPDVAERQIANIRRAIDSGKELREEARSFVGRDWKWYDINIQPYSDAIYGSRTALLIAIDITHRRQAEERLRESEERFRLQFKSLPIPAYIWEHNGEDFFLANYNVAAEKITRGRIPEYVGKTLTEMYGHSPEIVEEMNRCLREKTSITREMPYHMRTIKEDKFLRLFYVYVPPNLVVVHTEDITERRRAAKSLQEAHDELEERVIKRTQELAEANEALRVEREALEQKNIALREVLDQIEEGKKQMASQIQSNINRIVLPILKSLERRSRPADLKYIELLNTSLNEIASSLIGNLETRFAHLTPRELEVCNLVKNGLTSKEIADSFNTSVQTVLKQRATIRKKLGIANGKANLASFLKSLE